MTEKIQRTRLPCAVRDKILPETAEREHWRLLANCDETLARRLHIGRTLEWSSF